MSKGYTLEEDIIILDNPLTELDLFVKSFLEILKKHSDYLVVSGYVSICSGRTRATEDVDILVPILDRQVFEKLFNELLEAGFWCYQSKNFEEAYHYTKRFESLRFARNDQIFPNIEFVPFDKSKSSKFYEFNHPQRIRIKDFEFKIPEIEFEILYKELILSGEKDLEDAKHLRTFFSDILKEERFKSSETIIKEEKEGMLRE